MTDKTRRAIVAFGVAPCAPSFLYWVYAASTARGDWAPKSIWQLIDLAFWTSLVVTLPITLLAGLLPYLLINRHAKLRSWYVLGVAGAVGTAFGLAANAPFGGLALGVSAGVTFWVIWDRGPGERSPP